MDTYYTDFKNVQKRNKELAAYFKQPDMAVEWILAITNHIAKWISDQHDKGLWEVVRFVSWKRGVINKTLSREKFAKMVYTFCREALDSNESPSKLKSSMEHSKYIDDLKRFEKLEDANQLRSIVSDIEDLFDNKEIKSFSSEKIPTIPERLESYLRSTVNEDAGNWPFSRIVINPDYDGILPTMAVEKYQKKEFLNLNKPSSIEAYECLSEPLDKMRLQAFLGEYEGRRNIKLYIVSTYGLTHDVYKLAEDKDIGYVRINLNKEMTRESYVLPRSIGDDSIDRNNMDMLLGRADMTESMVIWDGRHITTSLADMLNRHAIPVKPQLELKAPYLKFDFIEAKADEMTKPYVDEYMKILRDIKGNLYVEDRMLVKKRENGRSFVESMPYRLYKEMKIDPFLIAESQGLFHEVKLLPASQLGRIDLISHKVTLNDLGLSRYERSRFTMAHELGHFILHAPLMAGKNIISFGDTEDTISENLTITNSNRKWFERQANHFASCLLMPRKLVEQLFAILYHQFVTLRYGDHIGTLYYSPNQQETFDSYNNVVGGMANILQVSMKAMELKLVRLNLLKIG